MRSSLPAPSRFPGGDPITTSQTFGFDGKESESTGFNNARRKSKAQWSADGQTLNFTHVTTMEREGQSFEINGTEAWSLKDGSLTIVSVTSHPVVK